MLPQSTIVSKNCWWNNPFLVRTDSGNSQRETKYSILRSVSKARNRAKVYQKKDKTVTMAPLGFLEWRCEGRLNQGFPSGLYLSRFTIYKTPPSLNSPGFSQVGCSWRFGPLRKTLSRQSFCELFSYFRKTPHTTCACEDSILSFVGIHASIGISPLNIAIAMAPRLVEKSFSCTSTSGVCQDFPNPPAGEAVCQHNGSE